VVRGRHLRESIAAQSSCTPLPARSLYLYTNLVSILSDPIQTVHLEPFNALNRLVAGFVSWQGPRCLTVRLPCGSTRGVVREDTSGQCSEMMSAVSSSSSMDTYSNPSCRFGLGSATLR
jgi:hypothetical protein